MNSRNQLSILITRYNQDPELNNYRDILDYVVNQGLYIQTSIKISKQRLFKVPKDDLVFILGDFIQLDNEKYLATFCDSTMLKYSLNLKLKECLVLINKLKLKPQIIINANSNLQFILNSETIKYLT